MVYNWCRKGYCSGYYTAFNFSPRTRTKFKACLFENGMGLNLLMKDTSTTISSSSEHYFVFYLRRNKVSIQNADELLV